MNSNRVISLFTGAGGLDIGLEEAGFEVAIAVENDHDCLETLGQNFDWKISSTTDITELQTAALLKEARLEKGEASLVVGGPPCQPFSKSGFWVNGDSKRLTDKRANTIEHYFRVVEAALPEAILFENVRGIGFRDKSEALRLIEAQLARINQTSGCRYATTYFNVNAAGYGVPQTRERFFMVAHRDGKHLKLPEETHAPLVAGNSLPIGRTRYATAWDAIGDLDGSQVDQSLRVRGKWSDLLPTIPEGHNYLWHTSRGGGVPIFGWRTRYWSFLLKLKKSRPSWTLQASPGPATGPFHWRNRRLSIREMARLQTFPDRCSIAGTYQSATRQLGNAVPPAVGELFGRCMMNQFFDRTLDTSLTLIPQLSKKTPRAHCTEHVSEKYLNIAISPEPHPGKGQGPRARDQRL